MANVSTALANATAMTIFPPDIAQNLSSSGFNVTALEMIPNVNLTLITNSPGDFCNLTICDITLANFTYVPSLAGNIIYLALFAALLAPQIFLGIKFKTWGFTIPISIGVFGEIMGYVGRVQLHYNPFPFNPFLIYLVCLTISPAFFSAGIYLCLSRIIEVYSAEISRLKPKLYTIIFVTCDLISLILQAAGGAITATADADQPAMNKMGVNIMIAGLASQVVSLVLFMLLAGEYAWRLKQNWESRNKHMSHVFGTKAWQLFILGLCIATITIFIRCVFRVVELSGGFNGKIANDQIAFMIFEGPMLITAVAALTIFHPGFALGDLWSRKALVDATSGAYGNDQKLERADSVSE